MRERRRDGNGLCRWKALTQSNRYAIIYCEKVVISYCVVITVSLAARNRASCICKIAGAPLSASIFQYFCIFSPNFETSGIFSYLYYTSCIRYYSKSEKVKLSIFAHVYFHMQRQRQQRKQSARSEVYVECKMTCYHSMVSTSTDFEIQMKNFFRVQPKENKIDIVVPIQFISFFALAERVVTLLLLGV